LPAPGREREHAAVGSHISTMVELTDLQGICKRLYIEIVAQVMSICSFALGNLWSAFLGPRLMQSRAST